jgi:hypothetical protein
VLTVIFVVSITHTLVTVVVIFTLDFAHRTVRLSRGR